MPWTPSTRWWSLTPRCARRRAAACGGSRRRAAAHGGARRGAPAALHRARRRSRRTAPRRCAPRLPQHGTNNAGLKLALWVSVDNTAATKILAVSLLLDETEESFAFTCECFRDCFRVAPAVIFTDSAPAIKVAVDAVFPDTQHMLCIWHLSKNLFTNVRPACGADDELWQRVQSAWWVVVKQSDASSRATFDAEWSALVALVETSTVTGTSIDTARTWLAKMAANREQWAFRWTWRFLTMGIHSTQRIEAVHSAIAGFIRANTLLTALLAALEALNANVGSTAATRVYRHLRLNQTAGKCGAHPITEAASKFLSPYALLLLRAQVQQAPFYTIVETEAPGTFTVTRTGATAAAAEHGVEDADVGLASARFTAVRTTTLEACSCQFPVNYGLPCRHQLQVAMVTQAAVPVALYHIRWHLLDAAQLRALTEELMRRRPRRSAREAEPAVLTRDDRYQLAIAACRGVAEVAASSPELYNRFRAALTDLSASLRQAAPAAPRRRRGGAAGAAEADGAGGSGAGGSGPPAGREQPAPRGSGLHALRGGGRGLARRVLQEHDSGASDSGENETLCHKCCEEGDLVCCDGCPHVFHERCLPRDAMALDCDPWFCPVCTGSNEPAGFVGRPQQPAHRGSLQRVRKRSRAEGTKPQVKAAKKARRENAGQRSYR